VGIFVLEGLTNRFWVEIDYRDGVTPGISLTKCKKKYSIYELVSRRQKALQNHLLPSHTQIYYSRKDQTEMDFGDPIGDGIALHIQLRKGIIRELVREVGGKPTTVARLKYILWADVWNGSTYLKLPAPGGDWATGDIMELGRELESVRLTDFG
jgi:hypothetical protein